MIKNFFGVKGSLVSDLFFQSLGLISILISFSFFITGIHIVRTKHFIIILQNTFFIILYSILASIFFNVYYYDSFWLVINGNGGFVGELLNKTFLLSLINLDKQIAYYFLIILILLFFLISVNFKPKLFFNYLNSLFKYLFQKKERNYTNQNEIISEYIPQDEIKNLIQEDLPFIKNEKQERINKLKFKLPSTDLLKLPSKNEREKSKSEDFIKIFEHKILDPIDKFKPEVILVSAGFDAHSRDPLANINLESKDFYEITKMIVNLANVHSNGKIISFLEGGYDLLALSESIKEHLLALKI